MAHRAPGLNLVANATVLWNTTDLARAVVYVRSQGVALTDEELSHVAPLRWDHIPLAGDYLWSDVEIPPERFRPLRDRSRYKGLTSLTPGKSGSGARSACQASTPPPHRMPMPSVTRPGTMRAMAAMNSSARSHGGARRSR